MTGRSAPGLPSFHPLFPLSRPLIVATFDPTCLSSFSSSSFFFFFFFDVQFRGNSTRLVSILFRNHDENFNFNFNFVR